MGHIIQGRPHAGEQQLEHAEARADLVVRPPGPAGELRVIDYKTGERDRSLEGAYFLQLREYRDILSEAWRVPVRGTLWYVESGASFEVT